MGRCQCVSAFTWQILTSSPGSFVTLTVVSFSTVANGGWLYMHSGINSTAPLIAAPSGLAAAAAGTVYVSTADVMFVRIVSTTMFPQTGFNLTISETGSGAVMPLTRSYY